MSDNPNVDTRLSVLETQVQRQDRDIQSLSSSVAILSDRLDRGFQQVNEKLDGTHTRFLETFAAHTKADAEADRQIIEKVASVNSWVKGVGVGLGIILPLLTWLVSSGLLRHI